MKAIDKIMIEKYFKLKNIIETKLDKNGGKDGKDN